MTRAEEAAMKAYPKRPEQKYITAFGTFEFDYDAPHREGFIKGYKHAEKDLALTWEDVRVLDEILARVEKVNMVAEMRGEEIPFNSDEAFYGEALRRFNEKKEKQNNG